MLATPREHGRRSADVQAQSRENSPQIVLRITFHVEFAHPRATVAAVQFLTHPREQFGGAERREILVGETEQSPPFDILQCRRDLGLVRTARAVLYSALANAAPSPVVVSFAPLKHATTASIIAHGRAPLVVDQF